MKRLLALVLLAVGFASAARADYIPTTWTDTADIDAGGVPIGWFGSYEYTHDLNDNGFRPGLDVITDFNLSVSLADDADDHWLEFVELAYIDLPSLFPLEGDGFTGNFNASGTEFGGWSLLGLWQLNYLGTLTITISSLTGDFNLMGSTLTANGGQLVNSSVPEPGALGLLGIGLVGMALGMRRRKPQVATAA